MKKFQGESDADAPVVEMNIGTDVRESTLTELKRRWAAERASKLQQDEIAAAERRAKFSPCSRRHWFTAYGLVGDRRKFCVRCGVQNPRWRA